MAEVCYSCSAVTQVQLIAAGRAAEAGVCNSCSAVTKCNLFLFGGHLWLWFAIVVRL